MRYNLGRKGLTDERGEGLSYALPSPSGGIIEPRPFGIFVYQLGLPKTLILDFNTDNVWMLAAVVMQLSTLQSRGTND